MKQERHKRRKKSARRSRLSGEYGEKTERRAASRASKKPRREKPHRAKPRREKLRAAKPSRRPEPARDWVTERKYARRRASLIAFLFVLGAGAVLYRAFELQVRSSGRYSSVAEKQAVTKKRVEAKRGVIKDRHGAELAISLDVDSIYAEPNKIKDPKGAAKKLAPILKTDVAKLTRRLSSKRAFTFLDRRVDPAVARKVVDLKIPGVGIQPEPRRFYSNRELAAHVLGFTSIDGDGQSGIERRFNSMLRGKSFEVPSLRDALGKRVLSEGFVPQAALEGDDLILTIDRHIQHVTEQQLKRAVVDNEGVAGVALVLAPKTGEILALSSYPSYNPNNLGGTRAKDRLNRAVSAVYEPGSTMKIVTIAGSLEDELVTPSSEIDCEDGEWKVGGRTIRDSNHKYGVLALPDVMKLSSNICSAKLGLAMGSDRLHGWLDAFGFGRKTRIELPGELRGLVRPPDRWRPITLANIAFGQGLSVTPLQIAQAASVIANDGVLIPPRIVKATVDKAGRTSAIAPPPRSHVLSKRTADRVTEMLAAVVREGGTAPAAAIEGIEVAGKTGTAQKIDPVTRAYSRSLYVASFVGFAPKDDPAVLVLVLVDEPKKSIYGGTVAAPAFQVIAREALAQLDVHPEGAAVPPVAIHAPSEAGVTLEDGLSGSAQALLGGSQPAPERAPDAWEAGVDQATTGPVAVAGAGRTPNFYGLPLREVLNRSADARCDLVVRGSGRVKRQKPRAGAPLGEGARCEVELSP